MKGPQSNLKATNSRKLNQLVGKEVQVFECGQDPDESKLLEKRADGFYWGGKKLPLRSVANGICEMDFLSGRIEIVSEYLQRYQEYKEAGVFG